MEGGTKGGRGREVLRGEEGGTKGGRGGTKGGGGRY